MKNSYDKLLLLIRYINASGKLRFLVTKVCKSVNNLNHRRMWGYYNCIIMSCLMNYEKGTE